MAVKFHFSNFRYVVVIVVVYQTIKFILILKIKFVLTQLQIPPPPFHPVPVQKEHITLSKISDLRENKIRTTLFSNMYK